MLEASSTWGSTFVAASESAILLQLRRCDFFKVLGELNTLREHNQIRAALSTIPLFGSLTNLEVDEVAEEVLRLRSRHGECILKQGHLQEKLYIITDGEVVFRQCSAKLDQKTEKEIGRLRSGESFGEESLNTSEGTTTPSPFSAYADSKTVSMLAVCIKDTGRLRAMLKRSLKRSRQNMGHQHTEDHGLIVGLDELTELSLLGEGSYGRVSLVEHSKTGVLYALKKLKKAKIGLHSLFPPSFPSFHLFLSFCLRFLASFTLHSSITSHLCLCYTVRLRQEQHVNNEKTLLTKLHHPFLTNLIRTFQDSKAIYLLLEAGLEGELFTRLEKEGSLPEKEVQFYGATLVTVLDYLHSESIIFRDIKPENCVLTANGYMKGSFLSELFSP